MTTSYKKVKLVFDAYDLAALRTVEFTLRSLVNFTTRPRINQIDLLELKSLPVKTTARVYDFAVRFCVSGGREICNHELSLGFEIGNIHGDLVPVGDLCIKPRFRLRGLGVMRPVIYFNGRTMRGSTPELTCLNSGEIPKLKALITALGWEPGKGVYLMEPVKPRC